MFALYRMHSACHCRGEINIYYAFLCLSVLASPSVSLSFYPWSLHTMFLYLSLYLHPGHIIIIEMENCVSSKAGIRYSRATISQYQVQNIRTHKHTSTKAHTERHTHKHTCTHKYTHTTYTERERHTQTHTQAHKHTHTHTHKHTRIHTQARAHTHTHT